MEFQFNWTLFLHNVLVETTTQKMLLLRVTCDFQTQTTADKFFFTTKKIVFSFFSPNTTHSIERQKECIYVRSWPK